jgi:NhaP-type Na+/H+ or K+/H+ antiporter
MGELLGFSGIITLFTCAIIMGHYAFMNISEESQRGTGLAFETVSYIAEAFVYAYLGASLLVIQGNGLAVGFAALFIVFFPLVRAAMVYFLPGIYYLRKKPFPL